MNEVLKKSLLKKIERLEAFEERAGIRFENISIKIESPEIVWVYFEAHSNKGHTIDETIEIEHTIYDSDNHIIDTGYDLLLSSSFFGFEIISFYINDDDVVNRIHKIRIYPKKR